MAVLIGAVRGRRARAAPDGGATGGVGDIHAVAEQLGDEACIGRLGAACAGAGELEHGLLELAALDAQILHVFLRRDLGDHVVEDRLLIELALLSDHGDGLRRADADADAAAHAVERGDSHGVLILALALAGLDRTDLRSGGAAAASSSVSANGRIVACGQTNAQLLHWMHLSASHSGTVTATPRFS